MKKLAALLLICISLSASQKVLIVGSGGREHTLAEKIMQSSFVKKVFVAPGNSGTASLNKTENIPIPATDIESLRNFALQHQIDLTIVGPEVPLDAGIVNKFADAGLTCLGPTQKAAQLESSKAFAKAFMKRHHIPTASYETFSSFDNAKKYIDKQSFPLVIKGDGLAAGKGVVIAQHHKEAIDAAEQLLKTHTAIVIEQFLHGTEVSFIALSDGKSFLPLATAQDYKTRNNNHQGPMTGGMGSVSPAPCVTPALHERIMKTIIEPTIAGMRAEGNPFIGFLYAGLMITPKGDPYVLEFNCRLGDPETQVILSRLKTDFFALAAAAVTQQIGEMAVEWDPRHAVAVVIADGGYPASTTPGQPIIFGQNNVPDSFIFHAGTKLVNNQLVTNGGRILTACALGESREQAIERAYELARTIHIPKMHYRTDIGR